LIRKDLVDDETNLIDLCLPYKRAGWLENQESASSGDLLNVFESMAVEEAYRKDELGRIC